ncbi:hypothetical protein Tsubulata_012322 [Turnera subulata]|uniref:Peptidase metallopeptidase domain-containing protein n=1 Tax=Turnera subulata TaxID=218843 RepID=A0A9Q0JSE8_9ROSI|nr:hypothetical protein Tsubulata_012322 [Turnera subulata]
MAASNAAIFLALICLLLPAYSSSAHPNNLSSHIRHLQGLKKGDKTEGIQSLKKYLHQYGYLHDNHLNTQQVEDRYHFDETTEKAAKTYQLNFNLKPTGVLDHETISMMMKPRCGVPDIINGATKMNGAGKYYNLAYALNKEEAPRVWPASRRALTWAVKPGTRKDVIDPLAKESIEPWSVASGKNFTFKYIGEENYNASDIKISFMKIDGNGKVLAWGAPPTEGMMAFDEDDTWEPGHVPGIGKVGLHEMGHVLGLPHSSDPYSIMFPNQGKTNTIGKSDVTELKKLYGF